MKSKLSNVKDDVKIEMEEVDKEKNLRNDTLNAMYQRNIIFREYFNELYPGFEQRLLAKEPSLNRTDLDFCAFLRMGLSTKEIENAAELKTKAVEYRKYKLRKIFNIDSKEDLYQWIEKI